MNKKNLLPHRGTRLNRFQTAIPGRFVHTVMDAHFDPDTESVRRPWRSREEMETVARIPVGDASGGK